MGIRKLYVRCTRGLWLWSIWMSARPSDS